MIHCHRGRVRRLGIYRSSAVYTQPHVQNLSGANAARLQLICSGVRKLLCNPASSYGQTSTIIKKKTLTTNRITLWNMSNNCTTIRTWWVSHFLCHFERWETSNEVTHHNQPRGKKKKKNQPRQNEKCNKTGRREKFFFFSSFHHGEAIRVTRALGIKRIIKKKIHYNNHVTTTVDGSWSRQFWLCLNVKSHI